MSLTEIAPEQGTCSAGGTAPGVVRRHTISLRCFVYPIRENCYLAECIDLDISAEGITEAEAKDGLHNALVGYLSVICNGSELRGTDEKDIRELILRPSPLTHRIRYYIARIIPKPGKHTSERFYTEAAPAHC